MLFWEASSQGLMLKNFVQKERDPEIPEQKKKLATFILSISEGRGGVESVEAAVFVKR